MNTKHVSKILAIGLFGISTLFITSCKREDEKQPTTIAETVKFTPTSQIEGNTYTQGDTVWIKMELSYSKGLHGYEITIKNTTDNNTIVFDTEEHAHGTTAAIDTFWVNNVKNHSAMRMEIAAIKDHDGNSDKKEITFHCHP